jgi:adenylate kinase
MAPIGDDTVKALQDLVNKLESRVKQLEDKLTHAQGGTKHTSEEGVRMILMGPPGAGMRQDLSAVNTNVAGDRLISIL